MTDAEPDELLDLAEQLYGLPLGEFTAARDAMAKERRGTELGAAVKRLRKPTTAAWVVDLLVRHETDQIDQVLAVGEALREAATGMDAAQLRQLTAQRRQLTAAVTTRARGLAREHGLRVTSQVADQVEATLTAAMIDAGAGRAVRSGLLVAPLAATGVGELDVTDAVAVPEALGHRAAQVEREPVRLHVVPDPEPEGPDEAALEEAREALEDAEHELARAVEEREATAAAVERLQARALQQQSEIDELRRRLAELETAAETTDGELSEAEEADEAAAAEVEEATRARDQAEAQLRDLSTAADQRR